MKHISPVLVPVTAACMILTAAGATMAQDFLSPMGPVAQAQHDHLIRVVAITMIVVMPVFIGVPLLLLRYRRRAKRSAYRPNWEFSGPLELVLWGVPILIVGILSWHLWHSTRTLDPYRELGPDALRVQVVGLDWKWLFVFPDEGVAVTGELVLPEQRPVSMALTTDTVMQSFMVPALAGQIYAMPGMTTRLNMKASRVGEAIGLNTQFNGTGFVDQRFQTRIVTDDDWAAWVASARDDGAALDAASYGVLARQGDIAKARRDLGLPGDGPIRFVLKDPSLFERVVGRYHTGRPVPPEQQPGTDLYRPEAAVMGDELEHH